MVDLSRSMHHRYVLPHNPISSASLVFAAGFAVLKRQVMGLDPFAIGVGISLG